LPTCNPLRLKLADSEQPFRRFECHFYQICLSKACVGRWESWACTGCEAFEPAIRATVSNNRGQGD
jgi:hypothetical protein